LKTDYSIALTGNKSAGKELLQFTQDKMRREMRDRCATDVQFAIEAVGKMDAAIEHAKEVKAFYQRRLVAIETGKWSVDPFKSTGILFDEKELNERR